MLYLSTEEFSPFIFVNSRDHFFLFLWRDEFLVHVESRDRPSLGNLSRWNVHLDAFFQLMELQGRVKEHDGPVYVVGTLEF